VQQIVAENREIAEAVRFGHIVSTFIELVSPGAGKYIKYFSKKIKTTNKLNIHIKDQLKIVILKIEIIYKIVFSTSRLRGIYTLPESSKQSG
jgi:hypothetical protein